MSDKPMGRPPYEPTEESKAMVIGFSCAGYTHDQIAEYFDIDVKTLRTHYRDQLDRAKMEKVSKLSNNAYKMAFEGNERMIEFVLKCQGRWSYAKTPEDEKDKLHQTLLEKVIEKL